MAESYLKQEKDEIIIRSSAADRQIVAVCGGLFTVIFTHR